MSLERLLQDKKIEKIPVSEKAASDALLVARRDVEAARQNLSSESYDWSLAISYNAMLQAGRAMMSSRGYRPSGSYRHLAVVEFMREVVGKEITQKMVDVFNQMRKKRHRAVYDEMGIVSRDEAQKALEWAEEFVDKVAATIRPK
ncbi:MAG: HEPN domain-containing protein [Chloroflexi bacterium]|nr:HEPN domain-containing protein [Chloroflexota bacterium]